MSRALQNTVTITEGRQKVLEPLVAYIFSKSQKGELVKLTFICTHNSRRSHFGQIWAQVSADYFGIEAQTFSGGTEATAFNPRSVAAARRAGFSIPEADGPNPVYEVRYSAEKSEMELFSKKYDEQPNPNEQFGAIMTCDSANEACPVIHGADVRLPILYKDPKEADDTPFEGERYDERCFQIATEMMYVMGKVAAKISA
ncbi:MAG: protein-tyrosine-phosphatase [Cyclobacteriaceae bacterium]